jgi:hypothetical protein
LIDSLTKAFKSYSKSPFLYVWGSLLYIFMIIICLFAAVGLFLIYFMFLSIFNEELKFDSISTMAVMGIIVLLFLFFANGLNAALAKSFREALYKRKTSLTRFFSYAMDMAPEMFGIMLIREFIWLLAVGPFIAIYIYFFEGVEFMDLLLWLYALFMTFIVHMLFTPVFVMAGGFGTGIYNSMKHSLDFLKRKHIFFIGLYVLFALVWLLNYIPFVQIAMLFFAYPVIYSAIIVMMEKAIKIRRED